MTNFLGLKWKKVELEDRQTIHSIFKQYPQTLAYYTFATLAAWESVYHYEWTLLSDETLLLKLEAGKNISQIHLAQPLGPFSKEAQKQLLKEIEQLPYRCQIMGVTDAFVEQYTEFCSHFVNLNDRNSANYLYSSKDLAFLEGRPFEAKRNLISQAERSYKYKVHPMTEACRPHCPEILGDIASKNNRMDDELKKELKALQYVLENFDALQLKGYVISIEGKPAAFSIFEQLNPTTAVIHFEKAERKYKGLYQLINRETAKVIYEQGLEFINREEDLGIAGLRKAKMSYHPVALIADHMLTFKGK